MSKTFKSPWLTLEPAEWIDRAWGRSSENWANPWLCDDITWEATNIERPKSLKELRVHVKKAGGGLFALDSPAVKTIVDGEGRDIYVFDELYNFFVSAGLRRGERFDLWLEWR